MSAEVASAYVSLIPSYRGGTAKIADQLGAPAEGAGRQSGRRFGSGLLGGLSSMKSQVASVVGGLLIYKGASAAASFAKEAIFGFNSTLQQSSIAFTSLLGSGEKAKAFLDKLQSFAKATPFEFTDLVKNSQLLLGMGLSAKQIVPDLTALGDSVASVGGSSDVLNNTILAFGQIAAKGKLSMDNVNQLLQGGIPTALKVLASSFHVTTGKMVEMISAGKVSAEKALPLLVSGLEKGTKSTAALGGMMDKQSRTFSGALSNIKDGLTQAIAGGFRPFFDATSKGLQSFASFLSGPKFAAAGRALSVGIVAGMHGVADAVRRLAPLAVAVFKQVLVPAFNAVRSVLPHVVDLFRALWDTVKPLVPALLTGLVVAFRLILAAVTKLGPVLDAVTGFLRDHGVLVRSVVVAVGAAVAVWATWKLGILAWTAVTKIATAVQVAFNAVMDANPILLVVTAIAALAAGLIYAYKHSETFRNIVNKVFHAVADAGKWMWNNVLKPVFDGLKKAWGVLVEYLRVQWRIGKAVFDGVVSAAQDMWHNFLKPIFDVIATVWKTTWDVVKAVWNNVVEPVFNAIKTGIGKVRDVIKTAVGIIKDVWSGIGDGLSAVWDNTLGPVFDSIKSAIGWIISKIQWAIDKVSWLADHMPFGPVGVEVGKGANDVIGKIIHHARGGMTLGPHIAVVGDNPSGREVILPTDSPRTIAALAGAMRQAGAMSGGAPNVRVFIGNEEIHAITRVEVDNARQHRATIRGMSRP